MGRLRVPKGDTEVEVGTSGGAVTSQSTTVTSVNTWLRRATEMLMLLMVVVMLMMMMMMKSVKVMMLVLIATHAAVN